ncbi:hypothetical protein ACEWY4_003318 [Coilia grayii]|uniref:Ig-like domain-containing protein n=1 Tax=Coilia grayii TaxID=363190 RepID=A0ABD1KQW4_9TELE
MSPWLVLGVGIFLLFGCAGCPVEIIPPSLVVRYGESALATCRALVPISEMSWNSTVGMVGMEMGVTELSWTVKELREWTVRSQCVISTEDGYECSKELPIIVYNMPDSLAVTSDPPGAMAEGKPYFLHCHIENIAPVQNLTVRWFKGSAQLMEGLQHQNSKVGPQNITSDLPVVPHLSDNEAHYRCQADLDLGPGGPTKLESVPFSITVYTGCPVEIIPPSLVVRYGESALATCRALVPISEMSWNSTVGVVGMEMGVTELSWTVKELREWTVRSQCVISTEDGYECSKELPIIIYNMPDSLAVTSDPPGAMAEGKPYFLHCHIENIAPVQSLTVRWFKGSAQLIEDLQHQNSKVGPQNITSDLPVMPHLSDNEAHYRCQADLDLGPGGPTKLESVPFSITVYSSPNSLRVTSDRHGPLAEGNAITLNCHIENIAPVQKLTVKWFKGDTEIIEDLSHQKRRMGPQNVSGDYTFFPNLSDNGTQYRCEAKLDLGPGSPPKLTSDPFNINVYRGCPIVISPPTLVVKYGESASADCSTFVPHNGIGWNSTLEPVDAAKDVNSVHWSVKELREWTVKPLCFISTYDEQCSKALIVLAYTFPDTINVTTAAPGVMTAGNNYTLTCHIQNVAPAQNLTLRWFKGSVLVKEDHGPQDTSVGPRNLTFDLHIIPETSDDGAQYRCEAELNFHSAVAKPPKLTSKHAISVAGDWKTPVIIVRIILCLLILCTLFALWYRRR